MIYTPGNFTVNDRNLLTQLMQENSFATLIVSNGDEPMIAHLPVLFDHATDTLHAHVARANPLWRELTPNREVLFVFQGPHHYVSPACYSVHPSVPTWNYAVVHAHGTPTIVEEPASVETMLRRLVEEYESASQTPWRMELPDDYLQKMISAIVAFEVRITRLEGKFKLSQNRPRVDQPKVVAALRAAGGDDAARLATLMEQVLKL